MSETDPPSYENASSTGSHAYQTSPYGRLRSPISSINSPVKGVDEALEEIRRYEDFTTTDWIQDAIHERSRQNRLKSFVSPGGFFKQNWRTQLWMVYEAGQAWIVVSIVGTLIGFNAAIIDIITEWLSDIKMGFCASGWWLNQKFCCWEIEDIESCEDWHNWSGFGPVNYIFYVLFAILFSAACANLVKVFAPYAAGSGISEIKCILAGFIIKGFLGGWTLIIKSITLPLAIASGLSIGKEGPSVHMACCLGNVVSRLFSKYKRNRAKMREILSASSAAGVAVAFGSPIGGVLFSFEEMSSNFPSKTMWRSFFCALVATVVLSAMNPFRTGKLVMFQVSYDREWHFFEVIFFVIIGIFGGLYGIIVIKYNLMVQQFRKKHLKNHAITEAVILAAITAMVGYFNIFLRIDMTESMEILFRECESGGDYEGLCQSTEKWRMVNSLLLATVIRMLLVILSYGTRVPAGIFVPSMAVGATFGRMVGILVRALQQKFPTAYFFATCKPDVPCITTGAYAFLGAGAALGGIMHITVSVVVIMFELTGALTYILPTMIVLMVTKAVTGTFGQGGIADRIIKLNGFPFLDKEEHIFGVAVSHVMRRNLTVLTATGMKVHEIVRLLETTTYNGFPVVQDATSQTLVGYIGRTELRYVIDKAKRKRGITGDAICFFSSDTESGDGNADSSTPLDTPMSLANGNSQSPLYIAGSVVNPSPLSSSTVSAGSMIDFAQYVNQIPLTVQPGLPLETVMEFFRKMGPRIILIEHAAEGGKLVGVISVKDLLKYIAKNEHGHEPTSWPQERRYRDEESLPTSPTMLEDFENDEGITLDDDDDEIYGRPHTNYLEAFASWAEERVVIPTRLWVSRIMGKGIYSGGQSRGLNISLGTHPRSTSEYSLGNSQETQNIFSLDNEEEDDDAPQL